MSFWEKVLSNVIAYGAVLALGGLVVLALLRFKPGIREKFWPLQRLRPGNWSGLEVLLAFVLFVQLLAIVWDALKASGFYEGIFVQRASVARELLWAYPLYFFLCLALAFGLLFSLSRTRPSHVGISWARWQHSVVQGILAFALATPVVLLLFALVTLVLPTRPHAIDALPREGLWPGEWGLIALQACVMAPILEELLCRGLLQGWLRRASLSGHVMVCIWTLFFGAQPLVASWQELEGSLPLEEAWQPLGFAACLVGWYAWRFYQVWKGMLSEGPFSLMVAVPPEILQQRKYDQDGEGEEEKEPEPLLQIDPVRWNAFQQGNVQLSIIGSAMVFAVIHSAWPSPIALYLLGLILGRLAHRSQSLIGPIVLHACFNAVAFGSLLYIHAFEVTNGKEETVAVRPWDGGKTVTAVPASHEPRLK